MEITHTRMRASDGVELHVARAGHGFPVILLHGFPENWSAWHHQIEPLVQAGFEVLAPDMRGYNLSDRPPHVESYGMRSLIDDVAALVQQTDTRRAHIVGHDWGGVIAWTFAGAYPELTRKLVIMNAPHAFLYHRLLRGALRRPGQLLRSWYVAFFQLPHIPEKALAANNYKALRNLFASRPGAFTKDEIDAYVDAASKRGALTAMLNYYRASREAGSLAIARAARAECETLVIWGEKDAALSIRLLDDIEEVAPLVTVHRIPEAGHWVQNEAPDKVNRLMVDFLLAPPQNRVAAPSLMPRRP